MTPLVDHDATNREHAALPFAIAAAPRPWLKALPGDDPDPHQQPVGEGQRASIDDDRESKPDGPWQR
jgi:hypothetical protein